LTCACVHRGVPATPRDGAAVEIVGLSYAVLSWLEEAHRAGSIAYGGVERGDSGESVTFGEWAALIKSNFEKRFFVPLNPAEDAGHHCNSALVHRRGIYRDTCGASNGYGDYQLRPNQLVAMVVAPELFSRANCQVALDVICSLLVGVYGMKTLDPGDLQYRGMYEPSDDGDDRLMARGFSYHLVCAALVGGEKLVASLTGGTGNRV
jgi:glycogen debranching enzyme